jgi:hypothetical protein
MPAAVVVTQGGTSKHHAVEAAAAPPAAKLAHAGKESGYGIVKRCRGRRSSGLTIQRWYPAADGPCLLLGRLRGSASEPRRVRCFFGQSRKCNVQPDIPSLNGKSIPPAMPPLGITFFGIFLVAEVACGSWRPMWCAGSARQRAQQPRDLRGIPAVAPPGCSNATGVSAVAMPFRLVIPAARNSAMTGAKRTAFAAARAVRACAAAKWAPGGKRSGRFDIAHNQPTQELAGAGAAALSGLRGASPIQGRAPSSNRFSHDTDRHTFCQS